MTQTENTPVLLIIYKRFATAKRVLDVIRTAKPRRLYIAANAPANETPHELAKVREARGIIERVDWPCDVITLFRTEHLNAKESITSGISWFFSLESEGIILEDDCVVSPTFFGFAATLLDKYRDDHSIFQIGASNFQCGAIRGSGDYYFSKFPHIWGWATWARAWKQADLNFTGISQKTMEAALKRQFSARLERFYWLIMFRYLKSGRLDTWDYQWMMTMWVKEGVAITPNINLVTNIGFGSAATNTTSSANRWANMETGTISSRLRLPDEKTCNILADTHTMNEFFGEGRAWWWNVIRLQLISLLSPASKKMVKGLLDK